MTTKTTSQPKRKFVSPTEFAAIVGCDRSTILRWLSADKPILRGTFQGKRWLIPVSEIERLEREANKNMVT